MKFFDRDSARRPSTASAAALAIAAAYLIWRATLGYITDLAWVYVILGVSALTLVQIVWRAAQRDSTSEPKTAGTPVDIPNEIRLAVESALTFAGKIPSSTLYDFITFAAYPATYRKQIFETVDFQRGRTTKTVSTDWQLDTGSGTPASPIYLPIAQPLKGRPLYNLAITAEDGRTIVRHSFNTALNITLAALIASYRRAYTLAADIGSWDPEYRLAITDIVSVAIQPAHALIDPSSVTHNRAIIDHAFAIPAIKDIEAHKAARILSHMLVDRYSLVIEVEASDWCRIKYSHEVSDEEFHLPPSKSEASWITRRALQIANMRSGYIVVALDRSEKCQSYYLTVRTPNGSYIERATLGANAGAIRRSTRPQTLESPGYIRLPQLGRSVAHVYTRRIRESGIRGLRLRAHAAELPGSDILAAIWLIIIAVITMVLRKAVIKSGDGNDVVAAALAYPVLLATAITIYSNRQSKSLTSSLSAFIFGLGGTILGSVATFVYFLLIASRNIAHPTWLIGFAPKDGFWQTLIIFDVWLAIVSSAVACVRSLRYWLIQRRNR
ncbi:hypothetical protein ACWDXV_16505 [Nocardia nova]